MPPPKTFKWFQWIVLPSVLIGVTAAGIWFWRTRKDEGIKYQTAAVARGNLTQVVTATGQLNPVYSIQVGSQISGNIAKLKVDFNDPVKQGQVVAEIDPVIFKANVVQAEGDLASARAALELARIVVTRSKTLRDQDATPQSNLDTAIANVSQAEALVKIKEGTLEKAKADLDHCTIVSPIDGIVISRNVDVGQTVAASLSAPVLFVIANDLSKMQIDANVAEADIGNVKVDEEVRFTVDAFPSRNFPGKVRQVRNSPITVQNVVTYDTVIEVDNSELKLKPGMTANVSIVVAKRENVLQVGNAALRVRLPETQPSKAQPAAISKEGRRNGKSGERKIERTIYVMKERATSPEARQIQIGISDGTSTEVVQGLDEGERVVIAVTGLPATSTQSASPFGGGGMRRF